jgi:hypothetical protein
LLSSSYYLYPFFLSLLPLGGWGRRRERGSEEEDGEEG